MCSCNHFPVSLMSIFCFANNKGGVAKTTSSLAVSHALHRLGQRVLLVDADPQANTSKTYPTDAPRLGLSAVLSGQASLVQAIEEPAPGLFLLPAGSDLARQQQVLGSQPDYVFVLRDLLASPDCPEVDYVVLDTATTLGPLTVAALVASQDVFIPIKPEFFATEGMADLLSMVTRLQRNFAPKMMVSGVFFIEWAESYRAALHQQVVAEIRANPALAPWVMKTTIRSNVSLAESQSMGQSIHDWAPDSNGAADYQALTDEILSILASRDLANAI
ncbi:MAG: ParA family protein [Hymenobacter sp.]|nr:MAG: ParA family protein [Hymenobacter sp.]